MKKIIILCSALLSAQMFNAQSLIEYYPLNEGSSEGVVMAKGTETSSNLTERDGKVNEAVYFDGSNFLALGNPEINATNGFTVSFWYKPGAMTGTYNIVMSKRAVCNVGNQFDIFQDATTGKLGFSVRRSDTQESFTAGGSIDVDTDEWQYVSFILDNSSRTVSGYKNGKEIFSQSYSGEAGIFESFATQTNLVLANSVCFGVDDTKRFIGCIDEIKLYDYNLSNFEINEEYKKEINSIYGNLIEYYSLDEGSSIGEISASGSETSTNLSGRDGEVNEAVCFDGSNFLALGNPEINATNGFTISFWLKPEIMTGTYNIILSKRSVCSTGNQFDIFYNAVSGKLAFSGRRVGTMAFTAGGEMSLTTDEWQFITITLDNSTRTIKGYNNGEEIFANSYSSTSGIFEEFAPNTDLVIANSVCHGVDNTRRYIGCIDEIKLYGATFTATQIMNEYASLVTGFDLFKTTEMNEVFYPNPIESGDINFTKEGNWEILSLNGELLAKGSSDKANLSLLAKGVYVIKFNNEEGVYTSTFIKQ